MMLEIEQLNVYCKYNKYENIIELIDNSVNKFHLFEYLLMNFNKKIFKHILHNIDKYTIASIINVSLNYMPNYIITPIFKYKYIQKFLIKNHFDLVLRLIDLNFMNANNVYTQVSNSLTYDHKKVKIMKEKYNHLMSLDDYYPNKMYEEQLCCLYYDYLVNVYHNDFKQAMEVKIYSNKFGFYPELDLHWDCYDTQILNENGQILPTRYTRCYKLFNNPTFEQLKFLTQNGFRFNHPDFLKYALSKKQNIEIIKFMTEHCKNVKKFITEEIIDLYKLIERNDIVEYLIQKLNE